MIYKDKRGQLEFSIVLFAAIVLALIFLAPIMMKVFVSVQEPISNSLGNVSAAAQENFDAVMDPLVTWWDKVVVMAYIGAIITLFVSSFLIDTHPFFVVFYIMVCFLLILFSGDIIHAADVIYESANFATEVTNLVWMDWIRNNYFGLLLGIIFLNGIIMYGKIALFPKQEGGR